MSKRVGSQKQINTSTPLLRWLRYGAIGAGGFLVVVVILQLLYPPGRLLPFVKINGEDYGGKTTWAVIGLLESKYKDATVEVRGDKKTSRASFHEVGIEILSAATSLEAGSYSVKQRLIPFSSVVQMTKRDVPLKLRVDKERVHYFAELFERDSATPAVNASVKVEGSDAKLTPGQPSRTYPAEQTYQDILAAPMSPQIVVRPKAHAVQAAISDGEAMQALTKAQNILSKPLTLRIGEATVSVDKTTLASWLDFPVVEGKLELAVQTELVTKYVSSLQPQGYQAPRPARIMLYDGRETGRVMGIAGRGVDINAASKQIVDSIRAGEGGTITLATVTLTPGTTYEREYSNTSAGLSAYLADLAARRGNYAITVVELGGQGRNANANGDKVYVAASTYKLFLAYGAFILAANGELDWGETISGMRADACLEAMIVHSDNDCAVAFGERLGWERVESMMRGQGLGSTSLRGDSKLTTANDLALFMRKLEDGSLLPAASRDVLLGYLKRQVYRNGIPAATRVLVANKVGRFGYYVHDAAVVYAPGRTYVLVIMSTSGDWNHLTATAREVHSFVTR